MPRTLPPDSLTCHAVGQAVAAVAAAWTSFGMPATAATVPLVRIAGPLANFTAAVQVGMVALSVFNNGSDPVFVTCVDPGAGASSLGVKVPAGQSVQVPLLGTSTPPAFWVFGNASAPEVIATALLAEVV